VADTNKRNSLTVKFRLKRFQVFEEFIKNIACQNILDVGGTQSYWETMGLEKVQKYNISLLNLSKEITTSANFVSFIGNAIDLSEFKNGSYDIVFSNSVIEHLSTFERQKIMADEVLRVGKHYFIQTPYKYFFMEPHYMFPFFQLMPLAVKAFLLKHFNLGSRKRIGNINESYEVAKSIRLLSISEMKLLFPGARIIKERFLFFTKSIIACSALNGLVP
jgi:hypothetical protein